MTRMAIQRPLSFCQLPNLHLVVIIFALFVNNLWGQDATAKLPWHLAEITWSTPAQRNVESLCIDVVLHDDVPFDARVFVVPINSVLNEKLFYLGAKCTMTAKKRGVPDWVEMGRGYAFSKWYEADETLVRPGQGGASYATDFEGSHVGTRTPYSWTKGKYTYKLLRMDKEIVNKKAFVWVGAFVYSHKLNENIFAGAIRFPGESLSYSGFLTSFIEVYDRSWEAVPLKIPKLSVSVCNLRINGQLVRPTQLKATYEKGAPNFGQAHMVSTYKQKYGDIDGLPRDEEAFVLSIGPSMVNRTKNEETIYRAISNK